MNKEIQNRVLKEANYILETKATIRDTAKKFNVSKSTVHQDLKVRIKKIDETKALKIQEIFKEHDQHKHIRGGLSTKEKYKRGQI